MNKSRYSFSSVHNVELGNLMKEEDHAWIIISEASITENGRNN